MEVMRAKKKTLSQLCEGLQIYPQVLENVAVKDKETAQSDPDVQSAVSAVATQLGDSGRILVRPSGTEPKIRVMVEAQSVKQCEAMVNSVVNVLRRKGHTV